MKRIASVVVASAAIAGTAVMVSAPAAYAEPECYPLCTLDDVQATVTLVDGILKPVIKNMLPGTDVNAYAVPQGDNSPVRYALGVQSARTVAAAPSNAIFLGSATVGEDGVAALNIKVPAGLTGKYTILLEGTAADGSAVSQSQTVDLSPATTATGTGSATGGSASGGLPFTGSDSALPLTIIGLGALAAGSGLVVVSRRRRTAGAIA